MNMFGKIFGSETNASNTFKRYIEMNKEQQRDCLS